MMETPRSGRPWVALSIGTLVLLVFGAVVLLATIVATSGSTGAPAPTEADQMRTDIALLRAQVQKLEGELTVLRLRSDTLETKVEGLPTLAPRMQPLAKDTK